MEVWMTQIYKKINYNKSICKLNNVLFHLLSFYLYLILLFEKNNFNFIIHFLEKIIKNSIIIYIYWIR